ncbi:peptide MFS transporter [Kitasatospora sp. NPDC059571]|uniref:peptide MFS transporter n=1 Tax=Kitasatospora sp. NPDC059571 TaxID=3346871 RepID=UPI0036A84CC6
MTPTTALRPAAATAAVLPAPARSTRRPPGFTTLFVADMWERFSFFGMLAVLFLFASAPAADGGLGLSDGDAGLLYGIYLAAVFLASVPGGRLGDQVLGSYRATLCGGVLIACGHLVLAVPAVPTVYAGLLLVAVGTGLFKPNLAALLGACYPRGATAERDAGFAVFYMSIQVSSFLAPLVVGAVGEGVDWHLGFAVAAIGMAFGLWRLVRGAAALGTVGQRPERPAAPAEVRRALRRAAAAATAVVLLFTADALAGTFALRHVMGLVALLSVLVPIVTFRRLLRDPAVTDRERTGLRAYVWLFLAAAVFWGLYVQGGSLFVAFARDAADRSVLGRTVPASWFQAAAPLFVLLVVPGFAWLWARQGERLGAAVKFAAGTVLVGAGLLVMAAAAWAAQGGGRVSALWLVAAYLLTGAGEAAFAPVSLSVTTVVAPPALLGRLVGVLWLSAALGAGVGGSVLKAAGGGVPGPGVFLALGAAALLTGAALWLARRPLTRRLGR